MRGLLMVTVALVLVGCGADDRTRGGGGEQDAGHDAQIDTGRDDGGSTSSLTCPTPAAQEICDTDEWFTDRCEGVQDCSTGEVCAAYECLPARDGDARAECSPSAGIGLTMPEGAEMVCEVYIDEGSSPIYGVTEGDEITALYVPQTVIFGDGRLYIEDSCPSELKELTAVDTGCPYHPVGAATDDWTYTMAIDHPGMLEGPAHPGETRTIDIDGRSWTLTVGGSTQLAFWAFGEGDGGAAGGVSLLLQRAN